MTANAQTADTVETLASPGSIARSPWMTFLALVLGTVHLILLAILVYQFVMFLMDHSGMFGPTAGAVPLSVMIEEIGAGLWLFISSRALGLFLGLIGVEAALTGLEFVVRSRSRRRGRTVPLIFAPLGQTLRWLLFTVVCYLVLIPKMFIYLLFIILAWPLDKIPGVSAGKIIDFIDGLWHFPERGLAWFYNLFFYNKIEPDADALTVWFNRSLFLWCIHH